MNQETSEVGVVLSIIEVIDQDQSAEGQESFLSESLLKTPMIFAS